MSDVNTPALEGVVGDLLSGEALIETGLERVKVASNTLGAILRQIHREPLVRSMSKEQADTILSLLSYFEDRALVSAADTIGLDFQLVLRSLDALREIATFPRIESEVKP